jgi:chemotaxis response regulator CheB
MMLTAVVTDQSLLVQGIISHFRHSAPSIDVQMVEIGQPNGIEKLIALQPDVVILESTELSNPVICPLNRLFAELPQLTVVEVNVETSNIQIIRSHQYAASGVADLLSLLEHASENPLTCFHPSNVRAE